MLQPKRHPEERVFARLEEWCSALCARPSFEARKKARAPQDDGGIRRIVMAASLHETKRAGPWSAF
ncbi:hypothetical protein [Bradyrhizobium sp. S69]|uniref:hypothetical protein n=1 Tax=Bradyrhizobium sp. S69 TaxID=1641856 RepID=UPI00131E9D7F|nr:hypothetical protein [Bradyrhizobium sp. S69]